MTKEEIIERLDSIVGTYTILLGHGVNSDVLDVDDIEAINEAIRIIKAIEDIKTDIQHVIDEDEENCDFTDLGEALEIIDRHIGNCRKSRQVG